MWLGLFWNVVLWLQQYLRKTTVQYFSCLWDSLTSKIHDVILPIVPGVLGKGGRRYGVKL